MIHLACVTLLATLIYGLGVGLEASRLGLGKKVLFTLLLKALFNITYGHDIG